MKNNIVYPIIVSGILAAVGLILKYFGFDFFQTFKDFMGYSHLKEAIFLIVSALIIICFVSCEITSNRYKKKLASLQTINERIKELEDELEQKKHDLDESKKQYSALLKTSKQLKPQKALQNFRNDEN